MKFLALDCDNMTYEDCVIEVKRIRNLITPVKLGTAIIKRSSEKNRHIIFPNARLSKEQELGLIMVSRAHEGWKRFTYLAEDTTIRVSAKKGASAPEIEGVIEDE
jgi:hypothetical protein